MEMSGAGSSDNLEEKNERLPRKEREFFHNDNALDEKENRGLDI
jgi:hypothetical protein